MDKVLSIIIPTYNMERYIGKCIDSLIVPSLDKLDIIVVNDGSIDKSSEIGHSYAKKYPNSIKVVDKENGNYGSCINVALSVVTGKYIKILDADDTFDNVILEEYIKTLEKVDVDLVVSFYSIVNERSIRNNIIYYNIQPNEILEFRSVAPLLYENAAAAAFAFNRKIFQKINYVQSEGISYTDDEWIFQPVSQVETVFYFDYPLYKYLRGRESQTMDPKNLIKNITHQIIGLEKQMEIFLYEKNLSNLKSANEEYLRKRIIRRAITLYRYLFLIYFPLIDIKYLNKIEETVIKDESIYKAVEEFNITRFKFKPIRYWRKWKNIPVFNTLPFHLLKWKNRNKK